VSQLRLRSGTDRCKAGAEARRQYRAAAWLPNTFYVKQFADLSRRAIVDFEEGIDAGCRCG
jgi:hypothetical protein